MGSREMMTRTIICQINAISDYVADGHLPTEEMQKILDAIEDAHFHVANARDFIKRQGEAS
jgi:hypothetical protein